MNENQQHNTQSSGTVRIENTGIHVPSSVDDIHVSSSYGVLQASRPLDQDQVERMSRTLEFHRQTAAAAEQQRQMQTHIHTRTHDSYTQNRTSISPTRFQSPSYTSSQPFLSANPAESVSSYINSLASPATTSPYQQPTRSSIDAQLRHREKERERQREDAQITKHLSLLEMHHQAERDQMQRETNSKVPTQSAYQHQQHQANGSDRTYQSPTQTQSYHPSSHVYTQPPVPYSGSGPTSIGALSDLELVLGSELRDKFGLWYDPHLDHLIVHSRDQLQEMITLFAACRTNLAGCWTYAGDEPVFQKVIRWKYGLTKEFLFSFPQLQGNNGGGFFPPAAGDESSGKKGDTRSILVRHLPLRCALLRDPASHPRCCRPSHICYSTTKVLKQDRTLVSQLQRDDEFLRASEKFFAEIDRIAKKYNQLEANPAMGKTLQQQFHEHQLQDQRGYIPPR